MLAPIVPKVTSSYADTSNPRAPSNCPVGLNNTSPNIARRIIEFVSKRTFSLLVKIRLLSTVTLSLNSTFWAATVRLRGVRVSPTVSLKSTRPLTALTIKLWSEKPSSFIVELSINTTSPLVLSMVRVAAPPSKVRASLTLISLTAVRFAARLIAVPPFKAMKSEAIILLSMSRVPSLASKV